MSAQPRPSRSDRRAGRFAPRFGLALGVVAALVVAAMLAGSVFGSAAPPGGAEDAGRAAAPQGAERDIDAAPRRSAGGVSAPGGASGAAEAATAVVPAAGNDGRLAVDQVPAAQSDPLAVRYTFPASNDVEVDAQALVLVQFNRPVAPITALAQRPDTPVLVFDPPVAGAGKWLTSSVYTFRPDGMAPNTQYRVRVLQNLSDLPGGALANEYAFSFNTVVPAVADIAPRDNTLYVDPTAPIQALFNQAVDQAAAQARFSLTADGGAAVAGSFSWPDDHTLLFQPDTPLPRGTRYTATAAGGPPPAKERSWTFTTIEVPRVKTTDPANGETAARLGSVTITFTAPMDHKTTEAALTLDPPPDPDNPPNLFWGASDTQLFINLNTQYSSAYRISVGAGATDRYGMPIAEPYTLAFTTQAPPKPGPSFGVLTGTVGTLSAYAPAQVFMRTTNLQAVDFLLRPLTDAEFRGFITGQVDYRTFEPAGAALRRWSQPVGDFAPDTSLLTRVDLGTQTLPTGGTLAPGLYLLDASAAGVDGRDRTALEVTKTNLVVKRGVDSTLVWAADLNSGGPVAGAPVTLVDRGGASLGSGVTAADGTVSINTPPVDFRQGADLYASLTRADDVAVATQGWSGSGPFGRDFPVVLYPQVQQKGYLYTDRPIYRAGEAVHLRFVLRSDDDGRYSIPNLGDLTLELRDSRGQVAQTQTAQLDGFGSLGADLKLADEAATGNYAITLRRGNDSFGFGSFLVAQFRVPEFEVKLDTDKTDYVSGGAINASVQADLFLGAPLAGGDVTYTVDASPYSFFPKDKQYQGYSFNDFDLSQKSCTVASGPVGAVPVGSPGPAPIPPRILAPVGSPGPFPVGSPGPSLGQVAQGGARTDAKGHAAFTVPADLGDCPTSQRYGISSTVTDLSRQQVAASKEVIVHRAANYAGVKADQFLGTATKPVGVSVVSVDTQGSAAGGIGLHATVYRRVWKYSRKQNPDGSTRFISTPEDTQVDARDLTTDGAGKAAFNFTPAQGGEYRLVVNGRDGAGNNYQAATSVYVTASDFLPWRVEAEDKLTLLPDKTEYAPGDVAHVLAPAPFAGAVGLVSVERGRILSYSTRDFPSNSTVIDVPITADMAPTVYLSVALLKPGQVSEDVGGYRVGYAQLKVSPALHALNVTLTPDRATLGPGDTVNFAVKATDAAGKGVPAELSLALVDQAVLTLADERGQPIFPAFWSTRPLGVGTGSTQGQSLNALNKAAAAKQALQPTARPAPPPPSPARAATPAAAAAASLAGPQAQPVAVRSDFQNTAYWKADVTTDANGNATVSIKLPDNLTTWRLAARGITTDTAVGQAETTIVTRKELTLRAVAPRFFTAGDSARLEALLTNRTDAPLDVTADLSASGLNVTGGPQRVSVAPGQSVSVGWNASAPDAQGPPVKLTFTARAASGQSDGVALTLPVNERTTPETVASSGIVTDTSLRETIVVPGFADQSRGSLAIEISASLAAVAQRAAIYLETWRYEPADVTAARLLDRVGVWQAAVKLQKPQAEQDEARGTAGRAIARLVATQRFDGGWTWWPSFFSGPSSADVTAQALYALGVANRAGLAVSDSVRGNAARFLAGAYDRPSDVERPPDANARAFWLLALSEAGNGTRQRDDALAEQRAQLGGSGHGALLRALLLDGAAPDEDVIRGLAGDLASTAVTSASGTHWEDTDPNYPDFANSTRATSLALLGLLQLDPTQPLLDGGVRWLAGTRANGYWRSLRETALAITAVSAFVVAREQPIDNLGYSVTLNGQSIGAGPISAADAAKTIDVTAALTGLPTDTPLPVDIAKQGSGQLYYSLFMRYFSRTDQVSALSNGITIGREVLPENGDTPVDSVKAGDLVRVRLTIAAPADLQYVRVEDFLPAGLEAVDASLKTTDPNLVRRQAEEVNQLLQLPVNRTGAKPTVTAPDPFRYRFIFNPFDHVEVRDDRVALFATSLGRGLHEYVYYARATTPGTFLFPPVVAEETDFPDIFARGDSSTLTVRP